MDAQQIRKLIAERKYEFSKHAERERESDMIPVEKLEQALRDCESLRTIQMTPEGQAAWFWDSTSKSLFMQYAR